MIQLETRENYSISIHRGHRPSIKFWIRLDIGPNRYLLEEQEAIDIANRLADAIEQLNKQPNNGHKGKKVIPV
ncbi:hypothetical protein [Corynebacterium striatum]|uniref:hypothetical protein n=1 Tax=Corynebacterium striatum TaxID=43770 RepID=UPI003ACCAE44|nr:hypothetical protein [Corynebacterium striatum]